MVAKRKARKDERELPRAARENPYALFSREELDAALAEVDAVLAGMPEAAERNVLVQRRALISDGYLWRMVRLGRFIWAGGKPKGSNPPIPISPGPPISDYVIEDRR